MTEPTAAPAQEPTTAPTTPPAAAAPPWGTDFDPEKAWNLVQNLRADKEKLSARPAMTTEQQQQLSEYQALVEASKSDAQRLQEQAAQAQRDAEQARADAIRYKAAATHGIPSDHFELLGSGTEDEVTARAQKIAELIAKATAPPAPGAPQTRPVEQLRPGASPSGMETADDVIYAQLFGAK